MKLPKTPSFKLHGKKAFVAGGSRGIGFACAVALAEVGAHVFVCARDPQALSAAVASMNDAGFNTEAIQLDVTNQAEVKRVFLEIGQIDILCNSAGMAIHSSSLDTTSEDFDSVVNLNLKAAYFLAQSAAKSMKGRGGSIIQISSQMAHVGGPDRAVYCATKHGVEGFNKAMAIELGPENIRVNSISPTFILTPMTEKTFSDPVKRLWINDKIKLPRVGMVEDIMGAVIYLASDASSLVTGTTILVDGGWTAD
ncbi:MAG: NAD(P)-dependent dehydrogenase (short-subunit alcohol dehydrogenase family) [Paracoccaceae bacterium]|jgi:NAD(P)-dependent dehydrogenase (short-subunit alcohol dehydrogenase family)